MSVPEVTPVILLASTDLELCQMVRGALGVDFHLIEMPPAENPAAVNPAPEVVVLDAAHLSAAAAYRRTGAALLIIGSAAHVGAALQAGADDYIVTPLPDGLLRRRIQALLDTRRIQNELKDARKALRETNERFQILFDHSPDAIFLLAVSETGASSTILDCNTAACRMNGYTREELIGQSIEILNVHTPDDVPQDDYVDWLRNRKTAHYEAWHRRKDGTIFPIEVSTCLVTIDGQEVVLGIDRNITERKQIETAENRQRRLAEALRDTAAALNSTLELDAVLDRILIQAAQVVPYDAASIALLTGDMARMVRCRGFEDEAAVLQMQFDVRFTANHRHMLETRMPLAIPDVLAYPGWQQYPQTARIRSHVAAPIVFRDEILGFIHLDSFTVNAFSQEDAATLRAFANQAATAINNAQLYVRLQALYHENLRHAAELEQRVNERTVELSQALERERELSGLKSRFVTAVSHEFRTPLAVMMTASDMLRNYHDRLTDIQRDRRLQQIQQEIRRMTQLLQDVLVVHSGVDGDQRGLYPTRCDLPEFCRSLVQTARVEDNDSHRFEFHYDGAATTAVLDEDYLRQIISHLLSNAVKYSPTGSTITLSVQQAGAAATICVRDEGIGIPPEDQKHLFEAFHRASNVGVISGTGLGLAIVKQAAELLGGTVTVDSQPGHGSTFTVTLPHIFRESEPYGENSGD